MTREEKVTQLGDRCKKRSCMWCGCRAMCEQVKQRDSRYIFLNMTDEELDASYELMFGIEPKDQEPDKIEYAYSIREYGNFIGEYDSIEECIEDAKRIENMKPGDIVFVGRAVKPEINAGMFMDDVLDRIEEHMYFEYDECTEGFDISTREGREEIFAKYEQKMTDLFNEYIKEIKQVPDFSEAVDVKEIVIE